MSVQSPQSDYSAALQDMIDSSPAEGVLSFNAIDLLNSYAPVFVVTFLVVLLATPIVRRIAIRSGIVDHPDNDRKEHRFSVAYLGGVAVFLGVIIGIGVSFGLDSNLTALFEPMPIAIVIGMVAIAFTGLADDIWGWDPRLKIAGQLVAAAALAIQDIGVRVAVGALSPFLGAPEEVFFQIGSMEIPNSEIFYWVGTILIALFVLGGCNAANLIDGLDGLLSGSVGIMSLGFLAVSIFMAISIPEAANPDSLTGARIVLSLALCGAVLGFLPYNFNPAVIFLGDCGSLLLGYLCVVIVLMFGEFGQTHLVAAGMIIFALPVIDTILAIIRRRLARVSFSTPDNNHIHHQMKRALGGVRRAVLGLYGITLIFTLLGVLLAGIALFTTIRLQIIYTVAIVMFGFIGAFAIKIGRLVQWQSQPVATIKSSSIQTSDAADADLQDQKDSGPSV